MDWAAVDFGTKRGHDGTSTGDVNYRWIVKPAASSRYVSGELVGDQRSIIGGESCRLTLEEVQGGELVRLLDFGPPFCIVLSGTCLIQV